MKMFWNSPIDKEIDHLIDSLDGCRQDTKEYVLRLELLARLYEAKAKASPFRQVDVTAIIQMLGYMMTTAYIISAERTDVVGRSQAWRERNKLTK